MRVNILNRANEKLYRATITKMRKKDFDNIANSNHFNKFKWDGLRVNKNEVFKIMKDGAILGLMQFFLEDRMNHILELSKLELSKENIGANKKFDYIAGCLIAYACLKSLNSFTGEIFVFYTKETKNIYLEKYGMKPHDKFYVKSDKINSIKLVSKYLNVTSGVQIIENNTMDVVRHMAQP